MRRRPSYLKVYRRGRRSIIRSAILGSLLALGACATTPRHTAPSELTLANDRYALAHGMAMAFMTSGRATGMDLLQVIHLDRAATFALARGSTSDAPANALIDYVTRREIDRQPVPAALPPEFAHLPAQWSIKAPSS